jgi:hypothetical protein
VSGIAPPGSNACGCITHGTMFSGVFGSRPAM